MRHARMSRSRHPMDTAAARCTSLTAMARGRACRSSRTPAERERRSGADGRPAGGREARRADPGHLPPRGPAGAWRASGKAGYGQNLRFGQSL